MVVLTGNQHEKHVFVWGEGGKRDTHMLHVLPDEHPLTSHLKIYTRLSEWLAGGFFLDQLDSGVRVDCNQSAHGTSSVTDPYSCKSQSHLTLKTSAVLGGSTPGHFTCTYGLNQNNIQYVSINQKEQSSWGIVVFAILRRCLLGRGW